MLAITEGSVWVGPADTETLQRIDPASNRVVAEVRLPGHPVGLASTETELYAAVERGDKTFAVVAVNAKDGSIRWTVPVGRRPGSPGVGQDRLFVPNSDDDTVSVIDIQSGKVLQTLPVGPQPTAVAVSGNVAWVVKYGTPEDNEGEDNPTPVPGSLMRLRT
jgi:virginiamycin B lyase